MDIRATLCVFVMALAGCATGSALVTGTARPAVKAADVRIYPEPPAKFVEIAIVSATPSSGWGNQAQLDSAVNELKAAAAKVGANGLIITSSGQVSTGGMLIPSGNSAIYASSQHPSVSGRAIYVPPAE
jgi:hypothetical protein